MLPFHSFVLGITPALALFVENLWQVHLSEMVLAVILVCFIIAVSLAAISYLTVDLVFSGVIVSLAVIWFFSYGHFYNLLIGLTFNNTVLGRERWLIPIWVAVFPITLAVLIKARSRSAGISRAMNLLACFLAISLGIKAQNFERGMGSKGKLMASTKAVAGNSGGSLQGKRDHYPSIYYIILDSYSAEGVLRDVYGYDNSEFYSYLERKGFYIAKASCSNYPVTALSLPSSLNMDYLDAVYGLRGRRDLGLEDVEWTVEGSAIARYLSGKGYRIIREGSWWGKTASDPEVTGMMRYVFTEFNMELLRLTVLRPVAEQLFSPMLRKAVNNAIDSMAALAKDPGQKFVFAHIICPHPPFVFEADGSPLSLVKSMSMRLTPKQLYVNQVKFINKRVEGVVDTLLDNSKQRPVIIIQADHGSGYVLHPTHNSAEPSDELLQEQFRILNAYYLPNDGKRYLSQRISPVNSMRVVLNSVFGEKLGLLPDRSFYSNYKTPLNFTDVTERVAY